MIKLEEFKKALGKTADTMTDEQINKLMEWEDIFCEMLYEVLIRDKNKVEKDSQNQWMDANKSINV